MAENLPTRTWQECQHRFQTDFGRGVSAEQPSGSRKPNSAALKKSKDIEYCNESFSSSTPSTRRKSATQKVFKHSLKEKRLKSTAPKLNRISSYDSEDYFESQAYLASPERIRAVDASVLSNRNEVFSTY